MLGGVGGYPVTLALPSYLLAAPRSPILKSLLPRLHLIFSAQITNQPFLLLSCFSFEISRLILTLSQITTRRPKVSGIYRSKGTPLKSVSENKYFKSLFNTCISFCIPVHTCVAWVWVWSQQRGKTSDKHAGSLVFQLRDAHWTIEHALVFYSCTWHSIEHPYLFMMKHVEVQLGKMRSKSYSSRTICVSKFISFVGFKLLFSQVLQPNPRDHPGGPV